MTSTQVSDARLAYECIKGRCSDSHWWRVRQLMKHHKLELTPNNVRFLAELRKHTPRSAIGIDGLLECHKKASEFVSKSYRTFKGFEIVAMLDKYGVKPHQSTVSRWFKALGGYKKNKDYSPEQWFLFLKSGQVYFADWFCLLVASIALACTLITSYHQLPIRDLTIPQFTIQPYNPKNLP